VRWTFCVLLLLVGVLVGFILGLIVPGLRAVSWTPTLTLGDALHALAILLVGVVIDYVYASQTSSKQSDTKLLLDLVTDARTALHALEETSAVCKSGKKLAQEERADLLSAERDLSNAVHSIEEGLGHCSVKLHKLDFEKLKDARVKLKESLTDNPFPGPYDPLSLRTIRDGFTLMRNELTRMAFAINRR
jgi:hypothetical protein